MFTYEGMKLTAGVIATIGLYSVLYKENKFYRFFEHLFLGLASGWALVALWKALEAGDMETADRISGPLVNIISLEFSLDAYLAIEKYFMVKQGIFVNQVVRQPFGFVLDAKTCSRLDRLFDLLHKSVFGI